MLAARPGRKMRRADQTKPARPSSAATSSHQAPAAAWLLHPLRPPSAAGSLSSRLLCPLRPLAGPVGCVLRSLLQFVLRLLRTFGLTDFEAELSTRPEKFVGEPEDWDEATRRSFLARVVPLYQKRGTRAALQQLLQIYLDPTLDPSTPGADQIVQIIDDDPAFPPRYFQVRFTVPDAVGTLLHPEPSAASVYAEIGQRFGSHYTQREIARRFGAAFRRQEAVDRADGWVTSAEREKRRWREIVGGVLSDVNDPDGCFEALYEHFARPEAWRLEPGADALFAILSSRGFRLGLASNYDELLHPVLDGLEGDLALDELLLEHLAHRVDPVLGHRAQLDLLLLLLQLDRAVRALEVEALRQLAVRLVHCVAHFLHVHFGDDVKGRHGPDPTASRARQVVAGRGGW